MPLKKYMAGTVSGITAAKGLMDHDWAAFTPCQHQCINRTGKTMQLEQESYLTHHPEVKAMMVALIANMIHAGKTKDVLKDVASFFCVSTGDLRKMVREYLRVPLKGPYIAKDKQSFDYFDGLLENDLRDIIAQHYPPPPWRVPTPSDESVNTQSSSFISILTSATTLPTPEPSPIPVPTLEETFFSWISNTVDKAVYLHVDENALKYDTAYVELCKAVEEAMEIPVIEIREDIADLEYNAYKSFELIILNKERAAAEEAWEKRMRKKLKRTLRRMNNFKGYETPPTPKSVLSSHESYKKPPPRPCQCNTQFQYNRYAKDRFGLYVPTSTGYNYKESVTITPAISIESVADATEDKAETKSIVSNKTAASVKSEKKTTFED